MREGRISPEDAKVHPQRHVITRTIGSEYEVDVDLYTIDARTGDRLLICSDGLTTMLSDEEIAEVAQLDTDPRLAADQLVDAANEAGGEDNITVVVVDVIDAPPRPRPIPRRSPAQPRSRTPVPSAAPDVVRVGPATGRGGARSAAC